MPHPEHFQPLPPAKAVLYGAVSLDAAQLKFYPEVRYRNLRVYPEWWHEKSAEPLLRCLIGPGETHRITLLPEFDRARRELHEEGRKRHVGQDDPLFLRWKEALARQEAASDEFETSLLAEGWEVTSEGLARYVHVDDLEKFEGPPPEGPF